MKCLDDEDLDLDILFEAEEILRFQKRYENGYDLLHDVRYNYWKKKYHPGGMWTA